MKKSILWFLVILMVIASGNIVLGNSGSNTEYGDAFFETHKKVVIREELASLGLDYDYSMSLAEMKSDLANQVVRNASKQLLLDKVLELEKAEYIYITEDGEQYSSIKGYIGPAIEIEKREIAESLQEMDDLSLEPTQSNPTPSQIYGGKSGAFERRQLGFIGFDGITANLTLPTVSNISTGEQPWVYLGFDDSAYSRGVEGGYSYQSGTQRWLPFIKAAGKGYVYNSSFPRYNGDTINNLRLFLAKATPQALTYTAYLAIGTTEVVLQSTNIENTNTLSVKRLNTIASSFEFNGSNINTRTHNQRWANVAVKRWNQGTYVPWSNFSEYSEWKNNMWYGTIDCTSSYIHRSGSFTSIYR